MPPAPKRAPKKQGKKAVREEINDAKRGIVQSLLFATKTDRLADPRKSVGLLSTEEAEEKKKQEAAASLKRRLPAPERARARRRA